MMKLVCSVLLSLVAVGCAGARPGIRHDEPADPVVGDLRCSAPRLTILEALYFAPDRDAHPAPCEAPRT